MQNRLSNLIDRANYLAQSDAILGFDIPENELVCISSELNVVLPVDFSNVSTEVSVDSFSTMQFWGISEKFNEIIRYNAVCKFF